METNPTPTLPKAKAFRSLAFIAVAIFAFGFLSGYLKGGTGDGGTSTRAFEWGLKSGALLVAGGMLAGIGAPLLSAKTGMPMIAGWAIVLGIACALMQAGGVWLGMKDSNISSELFSGFAYGAGIGAIFGFVIQQQHKKPS
jgi:hypothetical protein